MVIMLFILWLFSHLGEKTKNPIKAHSDVHRMFAGSGLVQEAGLCLLVWYFICTTILENVQYTTSRSIKKDSKGHKKCPKEMRNSS